MYLYGLGRTKQVLNMFGIPIKYANPQKKKVTRTLKSKHLTGQAVDIVWIDKKGNITWNGPYNKIISIGEKYGLRSLAPYEFAHFEDNGRPLDLKKIVMGFYKDNYKTEYPKGGKIFKDPEGAIKKLEETQKKTPDLFIEELVYLMATLVEKIK